MSKPSIIPTPPIIRDSREIVHIVLVQFFRFSQEVHALQVFVSTRQSTHLPESLATTVTTPFRDEWPRFLPASIIQNSNISNTIFNIFITVKWGSIEQFSMFFLNKIDCLDHMAPILQTYTITAFFFQMQKWLLHCACVSVKQPKLFKVAPSKWGDFEQREILWLEKLIQISPTRTVTICDMHESTSGFCTPGNIGRN